MYVSLVGLIGSLGTLDSLLCPAEAEKFHACSQGPVRMHVTRTYTRSQLVRVLAVRIPQAPLSPKSCPGPRGSSLA